MENIFCILDESITFTKIPISNLQTHQYHLTLEIEEMRIKKGLKLRHVGKENIIISENSENINFTNIISLNESATRIWEEVKDNEFTQETVSNLLLQWYDIDNETASRDSQGLIEAWLKANIIEE